MSTLSWKIDPSIPVKFGLVALALSTTLAVVLASTLGIVTAQTANFDNSYKTGPPLAKDGEEVTYTVVVVNSGGPAQDVVLSDLLPLYTSYVPNSCSYRRPGQAPQTCGPLVPMTLTQLWQEDFASGDRITTTFSAQVSVGSMQWPVENCAYLDWDGQQKEMCFTTVINPAQVYLPLVHRNYPAGPDLQVVSLLFEPDNPVVGEPVTLTLQVQNVGGAAAGPFWVDLYDNPSSPPTQANQTWNMLCSGALEDCYGIAWYIDGGLEPGQSVELVSTAGYEIDQTHWPDYFAESGSHDLYAFADSWNWSVWYGAVLEQNEGLDNRYGPVTVDVAAGPLNELIEQKDISIPWRPNRP